MGGLSRESPSSLAWAYGKIGHGATSPAKFCFVAIAMGHFNDNKLNLHLSLTCFHYYGVGTLIGLLHGKFWAVFPIMVIIDGWRSADVMYQLTAVAFYVDCVRLSVRRSSDTSEDLLKIVRITRLKPSHRPRGCGRHIIKLIYCIYATAAGLQGAEIKLAR